MFYILQTFQQKLKKGQITFMKTKNMQMPMKARVYSLPIRN